MIVSTRVVWAGLVIVDLPEDAVLRMIERAEVVFAMRVVVLGERIERDDLGEDRGLVLAVNRRYRGHEALAGRQKRGAAGNGSLRSQCSLGR